MNLKKLCTVVLAVAGVLLFASPSYAQIPQFVAVGSSGIFPTMGIAAISGDPITGSGPICGTNFWSAKSSSSLAWGTDNRSGSIPLEYGNIWVAWDNSATPTIVCAFLSVDSVVGMRLFLGQSASGNGSLNLASAAQTTPGANAVAFVSDNASGLPTPVFNALNGAHFNVGFTDIRPEDAQFAYIRAACNRSGAFDSSCFGYGPLGGIGAPILSSYSATSAQVVAFAISGGTDPITTLGVPATVTVPVGAEAVVLFYNATDTSTGGLGALLPTNITDDTAVGLWSGQMGITDEMVGFTTGAGVQLHVVQREPVSGTYNTFEWQEVHSRDHHGGDFTQEYGFGPLPNCMATFVYGSPTYTPPPDVSDLGCANPMDIAGSHGTSYGGRRTRAIGTGEMTKAVNSGNNPDSVGYAFFSLGTFGGLTNLHYLQLNGADPVFPGYSNGGKFPQCTGAFNLGTFSCPAGTVLPTFRDIIDGNYRIWNILRAVYYQSYTAPATGPSIQTLISAAQDQAAPGPTQTVPDILPYVYCLGGSGGVCTGGTTSGVPVFRSHYNLTPGAPYANHDANNGTNAGFCAADQSAPCIEEGGDMAGKVFFLRQDVLFYSLTGNEYLTWIE